MLVSTRAHLYLVLLRGQKLNAFPAKNMRLFSAISSPVVVLLCFILKSPSEHCVESDRLSPTTSSPAKRGATPRWQLVPGTVLPQRGQLQF